MTDTLTARAAALQASLRQMAASATPHYSPRGKPARTIMMSPERLEDLSRAADMLGLLCEAGRDERPDQDGGGNAG